MIDKIREDKGARAPLVLALDIGSSGVRAAVYDERGDELPGTHASISRYLCTTADGGAELDADESVEEVARTIDAVLAHEVVKTSRIECVAISCFWHSLVGVDDGGNARTPVYGWAERRAALDAEMLRASLDESRAHARTGCPFHPSYWPAKLLWLRRTQVETYNAVTRWMSFAELVALRFSGRQARASISMASGTGLFNVHSCGWDSVLMQELGISSESLPHIAASNETFDFLAESYARRWPQLRGARLMPAIGDGAANNIGAGCTTRERAALMVGTSGAMRVLWQGEPPANLPHGLWCYRADHRRVVVGGALSDGGGLWNWMTQTLMLEASAEELERSLATLDADAHGLTIMPFWAGERSTGWTGEARGAILGLTLHTRPVEILRAAMEAIAYRMALIAEMLETFAPGAEIIASGGALHASPLWAQMIADVMGRPLSLSPSEESSSRGAVLLALEATGKIKNICHRGAPAGQAFEPEMARHQRYRAGLLRQQKIYERIIQDKETARLISEAAHDTGAVDERQPVKPQNRSEENLKT